LPTILDETPESSPSVSATVKRRVILPTARLTVAFTDQNPIPRDFSNNPTTTTQKYSETVWTSLDQQPSGNS
jgi:hypothetical protein